jgi:hypothetical protein
MVTPKWLNLLTAILCNQCTHSFASQTYKPSLKYENSGLFPPHFCHETTFPTYCYMIPKSWNTCQIGIAKVSIAIQRLVKTRFNGNKYTRNSKGTVGGGVFESVSELHKRSPVGLGT